ncbi:MAG TPA: ATP-binding SpoIIE family protein phosphatase [Verrucomicrobiae bacterium]|jgi:anti-sigma regulatory factor (Ser/Thr protein kinase)|nr:ATP-binding SpoIIE family protein phosphatase [Verrucomicrobiae bacterium]
MQWLTEVVDASHAGEARRIAVECAASIGMNETDCGKVAIAVTEMATNLVKHAQHGKLLCEPIGRNGASGLRVVAIDKGPGIRNISAALQDGYSTYGSNGNGLGAIRRLSTIFDIYSVPGLGTCIVAEFWPQKNTASAHFSLGVVSLALRGEPVSGDGWGMRATADHSFFMVVDGLGHGTFASEAAREAERVLAESDATSAANILRDCHDALKKTRGAAAAIAEISREKGTVTYAGIGNISAVVVDGQKRRGIASHNGTLGHQMHKIQEFTVPWNAESILIMHSDGLGSKWDLNQYPGLTSKHPSIIAAMLYQDFRRERDDVTVMTAKNAS